MRDVLFRGKFIDSGEWCYGLPFSRVGGSFTPMAINAIYDDDGHIYAVKPETVGEFTGVTLPSGERLFEGDVLHSVVHYEDGSFSEELLEVYWDDSLHGFLFRNPTCATPCDMDTDFSDMKLVGNVYDNPDIWRTPQ